MTQNSTTSVTLSSSFLNALNALGVQASGFGGTEIRGGIVNFGITGGAVDLNSTRLEILHSGGLTFRAGQATVRLTDFIISNLGDRTVITGLATVNGNLVARLPVFRLTGGGISTSVTGNMTNLDLTNVDVALTASAAGALNQAFGVNAFVPRFNVGTAQVDVQIETATGDVLGAIASPRDPVGVTSLTLGNDLVRSLTTLGVEASGFGDTTVSNGIATFEIIGGGADLRDTQVEIIHSGGLTLKNATTTVTLTDFVISNLGNRTVITGLAAVNGNLVARLPLFRLEVGAIASSASGDITNLDLTSVDVRLTQRGAQALNQAFGVDTFVRLFSVGTAQVNALVETTTGDVLGNRGSRESIGVMDAPESGGLPPTMVSPTTLDVVQAGDTSVTLSSSLLQALETLGVQASGFGGTAISNGVADFLITGGAADLTDTQVEIIHSGGLSLRSASTTVNLTDFIISNVEGGASLSGLVTVNGDLLTRATLFDLHVGQLETSDQGDSINLNLADVSVNLAGGAAEVLNQVFGVTAFTAGFNIGVAQVDALVS